MGLIRPGAAATFVTPAQFAHEVLEMGRQARWLRKKALLQPFTHGVTDRSTGLAIDRFDVVADSAARHEFRVLITQSMKLMSDKSPRRNWFPTVDRLHTS
jgi:hypothetical protein